MDRSSISGSFDPAAVQLYPFARHAQRWETSKIQTLFGPIETKAQARKRAQRIVHLLGAIEEAPQAIRCCESHTEALEYFIERSLQVQLDPNDRDGLQRLIGDTEEVLTEEDCNEMRSNQEIWRPYLVGWIGARPGDMYAAALHPKEVDYLHNVQESVREDMEVVASGVQECQAELAALKALGPLPEDIAQRYALTPEGDRSTTPAGKRAWPSR